MKYILLILVFMSGIASSKELKRSTDLELAHILGTMDILYKSKQHSFPYVEVIQSWEEISECDGPYESCPDARLFIVSLLGDLGEPPLLYELPKSKGWHVESSEQRKDGLYIRLITTLEHANVSRESRKLWTSKTYTVRVSADYGMVYLVE